MCDPNATIRIKLHNEVVFILPCTPSLFPIAGESQLSNSLLVLQNRAEDIAVDRYGSVATQAYCHPLPVNPDRFDFLQSDWLAQVPGQHSSDCRLIFTTQGFGCCWSGSWSGSGKHLIVN